MKTPDEERGPASSWLQTKVKQPAASCYQRYFVEAILRQKPLPPSHDGRHIPLNPAHGRPLIDERRGHGYISNSIRSSRYTLVDFLPKQLLFQATRLSNFYFICIGVPQTIPGLSTTGNYTTILPLAFFILLTMAKEGYDDFCRHKLDKVENNNRALVLRRRDDRGHVQPDGSDWERVLDNITGLLKKDKSGDEMVEEKELDEDDTFAWAKTKWHNIAVGNVIKLKRDDPIPADIALLYSSGENGVAYVETMGLDGETNLKPKQAPPDLLNTCSTVGDVRNADVEFVIEDPNPNLYDFNGRVTINGKTLPLTLNEVILRGSVLRNTAYIYGLVINTGEECTIRQNANHHPKAKTPRLEKYANQVVLTLIVYVVVLSVGVSMGYLMWHSDYEKGAWYLENAAPEFKQIIIGFLIMFNNVIPLALYISLEIVKVGQLLMVQSDVKMYDEASNTPMTCNTNTILENLGQISYILSDKTGTLTENVMRFRGISLGGVVWMHEPDAKPKSAPEVESVEKSNSKVITQTTKDGSVRPSFENPSIVVEEREISSSSRSHHSSEPRVSQMFTRRSLSRPRQSQAERTTAELLQIVQRQPNAAIARKAREFILGLAICHTALPELDDKGKIEFQASSPDELALVRAAQDLGFLLIQRSSQKIELLITATDGTETKETYEILEVIEFSSRRKRMSIVVRCPDNRIWLICKGADSAIIPRLRQAELAERQSQEVRRSADYGRSLARKSEQNESRNSFGARPSLQIRGRSSMDVRRSIGIGRATLDVPRPSHEIRRSLQQDLASLEDAEDSTLFAKCFEHIDAFATEGLRTLLFAHKYLKGEEYESWKKIHHEATTSLVHRQDRIHAAGEMIEQGLDLLGASAIEDKLQKGVPETIEKLRQGGIKIWMLTGDKRETAINIAHSARICQPTSVVSILDSSYTRGRDLTGQMNDVLLLLLHEDRAHRVVVIDGQTLTIVSANPELKHLFFGEIITKIDSVIVCRASPAQKASIVEAIRERLPGLTLAIGDGANDIAMIQAAHVGIGLSGKEGLQAARVADFSIAQFRFLQRLLLVHGRYQYVRTAKFVLLTFWKEMFFYMMQALYQRYNGYTGTSLYESWSLTVLNTLIGERRRFTSLCVIVPGIFEQDLHPTTLLAVPELYSFGPLNRGLNLPMYIAWMFHGAASGLVVWFVIFAAFGGISNTMSDRGLFALGDLAFSIGILWINWKCLVIETRLKSVIVGVSWVVTVGGWWAWNGFMAGVYGSNLSPYDVKGGFSQGFGRDLNWWGTIGLVLGVLGMGEVGYAGFKRGLWYRWPRRWRGFVSGGREEEEEEREMSVEIWQELERDEGVREQLRGIAGQEADEGEIIVGGTTSEVDRAISLEEFEIEEIESGRRQRWFCRS